VAHSLRGGHNIIIIKTFRKERGLRKRIEKKERNKNKKRQIAVAMKTL
jgi:hypothetical protein